MPSHLNFPKHITLIDFLLLLQNTINCFWSSTLLLTVFLVSGKLLINAFELHEAACCALDANKSVSCITMNSLLNSLQTLPQTDALDGVACLKKYLHRPSWQISRGLASQPAVVWLVQGLQDVSQSFGWCLAGRCLPGNQSWPQASKIGRLAALPGCRAAWGAQSKQALTTGLRKVIDSVIDM